MIKPYPELTKIQYEHVRLIKKIKHTSINFHFSYVHVISVTTDQEFS